ncbi:unnamed protein product [Lactuca virosa]|uniref:Uncharacterized protein n=1 Tax=Lactuca virosa TaxID=75947 RepID=A0AAU9PMN1_9ASTR|nr:unnamed protein product [Lactuca virosa]
MRYTVKKNYTMYAWELGNELSGSRVGTRVSASQYAFYTRPLANIVQFSFIYKFLLKHYLDDIVKYNVVTGRNGVGYVV